MWIQDFDGDKYRVGDAFDGDGDLTIASIDYPRAEVAKLRDHLNTLLGDAPAAKAETSAVGVGREYRLLPGAYRANREWRSAFEGEGVTRVRLIEGVDSDGDVRVQSIDGTEPGDYAYVLPRFLAPLTEEPAPGSDLAAVAASAHAVAATLMSDHRYPATFATAFKRFAEDLDVRSHL